MVQKRSNKNAGASNPMIHGGFFGGGCTLLVFFSLEPLIFKVRCTSSSSLRMKGSSNFSFSRVVSLQKRIGSSPSFSRKKLKESSTSRLVPVCHGGWFFCHPTISWGLVNLVRDPYGSTMVPYDHKFHGLCCFSGLKLSIPRHEAHTAR